MEDGSEDAEAAAIGEGWARTLRELTLREGRSRRSEVVGTLPAGEEIFIASLIGMRAQVTSPRTGWISTSWEKQATVEALEVERTSPETNDDALSLADLPPIGPGWARTLVEANVREGRAKRSELRGALPAGSRVLIAEVRGPRAQLSQPYEGWISVVTAQQEPVLVQEEGPARKRSSSSEAGAAAATAAAAAATAAAARTRQKRRARRQLLCHLQRRRRRHRQHRRRRRQRKRQRSPAPALTLDLAPATAPVTLAANRRRVERWRWELRCLPSLPVGRQRMSRQRMSHLGAPAG
ncbi:unnamed protein product [Effrenium voratum]|nr:unnamed protein product [Effrenium voratum]